MKGINRHDTLIPHRNRARAASQPPATLTFTHQDKVMFPEIGLTKGDVLRFYARIAPHLLPHLRDRPVTVERFPEGLTGTEAPHFWQKNIPASYPACLPCAVALPMCSAWSVGASVPIAPIARPSDLKDISF